MSVEKRAEIKAVNRRSERIHKFQAAALFGGFVVSTYYTFENSIKSAIGSFGDLYSQPIKVDTLDLTSGSLLAFTIYNLLRFFSDRKVSDLNLDNNPNNLKHSMLAAGSFGASAATGLYELGPTIKVAVAHPEIPPSLFTLYSVTGALCVSGAWFSLRSSSNNTENLDIRNEAINELELPQNSEYNVD